VLAGTHFDLTIDQLPVNFTGRDAIATAVNGSVPGPVLRWREGDTVTLAVTNRLPATSSIHWHGIRTPADMDGVPGLSFPGIAPNETFIYRFLVPQSGTYWYHSHSAFQEQTGLYGPLVIDPIEPDPVVFDREYVVMLSDWTDEAPRTVVSNLKQESTYYNFRQRTVGDFARDARQQGLAAAVADRWMWAKMNMSPTDILDVSGATYTYLVNGWPPGANWTALFRPGERIRLRFINGSAMTIFDVKIPGLAMTVVQSDGNNVEPVTVDEFRISVAETYDVIVEPTEAAAFTIFAQAEDRTGYARATLAPAAGMTGALPPMDPRPQRTMLDMGMGMHAMPGKDMAGTSMPAMDHRRHMVDPAAPAQPGESGGASGRAPVRKKLREGPTVDNVAEMPTERLSTAGEGLVGPRVLTYADLRARHRGTDPRPPSRDLELHLTGNMERFIWTFDGEKFSDAEPIRLALGERVRLVLINDSMMEHPIHLHGLWSELENGHGEHRPYKHTINVKPGERLSYLVSADTPGHWAFHCHLLYHMEMGMFRTVIVA
jgi:CopA family copper-resistance protein